MALTDDQRALLRLLAQREEGYEDIAALMGLSVEEVRARVRGALRALDEGGAASPPATEPPAAGPPGRAEPREKREEPAAPPPAAPPAPSRPRRPSLPRLKLPGRRRLAEIGGGLLVAILAVLFAAGVIDVGGGDPGDAGSSEAAAGQSASDQGGGEASGEEKAPTRAVLRGVGETPDAKGVAVFGRARSEVVLLFGAEGLQKTPQGSSYAISLVKSPGNRIPIAAARVKEDGQAAGQYPVASNVLGLLANGYEQMEVSLVDDSELRSALKTAQKRETTPTYGGKPALRGRVTGPIVDFEGGEAEGE